MNAISHDYSRNFQKKSSIQSNKDYFGTHVNNEGVRGSNRYQMNNTKSMVLKQGTNVINDNINELGPILKKENLCLNRG